MVNKVGCVNDDNFNNQVLLVDDRFFVLVDFWADWCNPCKLFAPILDNIVSDFHDKLIVTKLNIDESPIITKKYNVRSIPTILLFHSGEVIGTKIGSMSKRQLLDFLNVYL